MTTPEPEPGPTGRCSARGRALDAARGRTLDAARGRTLDAARGRALDAARGRTLDAARGRAWATLAVHLVAARTSIALAIGRSGAGAERLDRLAEGLARASGVANLAPEELADALSNAASQMMPATAPTNPAPLLLDVRTWDEHVTSHIAGAFWVTPTARRLEAPVLDACRGRRVVAYCAVGVRSSLLALRLGTALERAGALTVTNLAGGLFAWHRAGLPLRDADGPTRALHTFDHRWGRLLEGADWRGHGEGSVLDHRPNCRAPEATVTTVGRNAK